MERGTWEDFDRTAGWAVTIFVVICLYGGYVLNGCNLF